MALAPVVRASQLVAVAVALVLVVRAETEAVVSSFRAFPLNAGCLKGSNRGEKALPGVCSLSDHADSSPDSGLGPARYLNNTAPVPSKGMRVHRLNNYDLQETRPPTPHSQRAGNQVPGTT